MNAPAIPRDRPDRDEIRDAFEWLAWWHTDNLRAGLIDQSAAVREVLGQRAYEIITSGAAQWYSQHRQERAA